MSKSTVDQIRERFDGDVERFSNLETGQAAIIDAPLSLALIAEAAARVTPHATSLLDVGRGAGNYTLKVLERLPNLEVTFLDEVFANIALEDTPRPLMFQLDLLRAVGFSQVERLHKNTCFAAFGAIK
jgi:16S rRNA A1518/A1519 N6-dimethyltransferase RsmA/KsgA/DIM1 with predicted DNA glycosylase/AP lyase activity